MDVNKELNFFLKIKKKKNWGGGGIRVDVNRSYSNRLVF